LFLVLKRKVIKIEIKSACKIIVDKLKLSTTYSCPNPGTIESALGHVTIF